MPVDRPLAADLADNLVTLYQQAETRLAADMARRLASGMDSPTWAQDKLLGLTTLRRFSQNLVSRLDGALADEVAQSTILAYIRGGTAAMNDLGRAQSTHPEWLRLAGVNNPNDRLRAMIERRQAGIAQQLAQARRALPGADAIARLAFSLTTALRGTHLRIARWQLDSYREVIAAGTAPDVLLGLSTRRRASQVAWEQLLSQGITGFVDRSGRGWNLASYVEMASRSTVAQAAVEGHLDRLSAAGLDLVIVSDAPQECKRCRPWEGKILTRGGPGGKRTVQVEHGTRDGQLVDVDVAGSVNEAIGAGLMHPNCRHSLSAYLPGVTRVPTNTEDPEGDAARQRLRALERKVRSEKLKAETTIDPAAKAGHEAKVRATQGQIREHVKATGLHRQPIREQIDLGHRPPPGPTASTTPTPPPPPTPAPPTPAPPKPKPKPAKTATPAKATKKAAKKAAKTAPPPPKKATKAAPTKKSTPTKAAKKTAPRKTTPPPPQKAAKAAAPPPAPREVATTPAAAPRAQSGFPESRNRVGDPRLRQQVQTEMDRQASLTPRQAAGMREVVELDDALRAEINREARRAGMGEGFYDSTAALYTPDEQRIAIRPRDPFAIELNVRGGVNTGWYARCAHEAEGVRALIAHEFGHHLTYQGLEVADRATRVDFWERTAAALGLPAPPGISFELLDAWVERHKMTVSNLVSRYGSTNSREMLAEIWQEYSTNPDGMRGPQRLIGDLLKAISEREPH